MSKARFFKRRGRKYGYKFWLGVALCLALAHLARERGWQEAQSSADSEREKMLESQSGQPTAAKGDLIAGRVLELHDGDTLSLRLDSGEVARLRLWGVDAPELAQAHGQAAMAALGRLAGPGTEVTVELMNYDQFGRLVGQLRRRGGTESVNRLLVAEGLAWVFGRYCNLEECRVWRADQNSARQMGLGLWAKEDPQPPWLWRRENPRQ